MSIPIPNLSSDDMKAIYDHAKDAMSETEAICSSTSLADLDNHQTALEEAQSGLETMEHYLVMEINKLKASLDAVKAMGKDCDRHHNRCKRAYWALRNSQPKA